MPLLFKATLLLAGLAWVNASPSHATTGLSPRSQLICPPSNIANIVVANQKRKILGELHDEATGRCQYIVRMSTSWWKDDKDANKALVVVPDSVHTGGWEGGVNSPGMDEFGFQMMDAFQGHATLSILAITPIYAFAIAWNGNFRPLSEMSLFKEAQYDPRQCTAFRSRIVRLAMQLATQAVDSQIEISWDMKDRLSTGITPFHYAYFSEGMQSAVWVGLPRWSVPADNADKWIVTRVAEQKALLWFKCSPDLVIL